jgi:hypothetical protein
MACDNCSNGCSSCGNLEVGTGPAGLDGQNAYTKTNLGFNQPSSVGVPVVVSVDADGQLTGLWAKVGQTIFIEGGGYYEVISSTTTTITVEIPDAATLAYNHALTAGGDSVSFPAGVSPAGLIGPQGATGGSTTGQDGTTQLVSLWGATAASGTSFSALHSVINLPSSGAALLWPTIGSVLRIHLASVMSTVSGNDLTNHWRGEVQIVLDGVSLTVPVSSPYLSSRTYSPMNGMAATIDVSAISLSPLELVVDVRSYQTGLGSYDGTNGYAIANASASVRAIFGNAFASGYTSGVDQSSNVTLQVNGRRIAVGTPGGSPSLFMPMLKVERLIKP